MLQRILSSCCLFLLVVTLNSVAFATDPYASIIVYNQNVWANPKNNGPGPNTNPLLTLNIINMTPWDIFIGDPTSNSEMFPGMSSPAIMPLWLKGVSGNGSSNQFAFPSVRIPLVNPNNLWVKNKNLSNVYAQETGFISIPIVFNSVTGIQIPNASFNGYAQSIGNTAALSFMVTSSAGFEIDPGFMKQNYVATALSFGDGANSYGWQIWDTSTGNGSSTNSSQFFTIQALQGGNTWQPVTQNLAEVIQNNGVKCPTYLTTSGLAYPKFSDLAGKTAVPNLQFDLVAILQAGNYADNSLIFMAVPTSNNAFLKNNPLPATSRIPNRPKDPTWP